MAGSPDTERRSTPTAPGAKVACVFLCPNPTCDTELVVLPEQAGQPVECPTCGFRFLAPDHLTPDAAAQAIAIHATVQEVQPAAAPPPPPRRASAPEAKAADALDSLAAATKPRKSPRAATDPRPAAMVGGHVQYPAPPAPTRAEVTADRLGEAYHRGKDRRRVARIGVGERLLATTVQRADRARGTGASSPEGAGASRKSELILTWVLAVLASCGMTAAGLVTQVTALALGSIVFLGLAAVITVLLVRRKGRTAAE